jgi:hypothetical protein
MTLTPTICSISQGGSGQVYHKHSQKHRGKDQLGRDDVEHVRPDLIALLSTLRSQGPHCAAARPYPEPGFEKLSCATVGAAKPDRAPEQSGGVPHAPNDGWPACGRQARA